MQHPVQGPRVLLRRLREVMAGPEATQDRLDRITTLIASNMVAEVCSIYVMRDAETLELFATEGLRAEAVHNSTLRIGEGLVRHDCQRSEPVEPVGCAQSSFVQISAGNG